MDPTDAAVRRSLSFSQRWPKHHSEAKFPSDPLALGSPYRRVQGRAFFAFLCFESGQGVVKPQGSEQSRSLEREVDIFF